jgi:hypothetical protein
MKIKITSPVVFKDCYGAVLREFKVGEVLEASVAVKDDSGVVWLYVTSMGGIYSHEAELVVSGTGVAK